MPHDISGAQLRRRNALYTLQRSDRVAQPGCHTARKVDLAQIAGDDHAGIFPKPRQKHFHLNGRGVLCLVKNDISIRQGPAAHKGQWCHFDFAGFKTAVDLFGRQHVVESVIERAQIGVDLVAHIARQKPQTFPGFNRRARQYNPVHPAGGKHRHRHSNREIGLSGSRRSQSECQLTIHQGAHVPLLPGRSRRDMTFRCTDNQFAAVEFRHPGGLFLGGAACQPYRRIDLCQRNIKPVGKPDI